MRMILKFPSLLCNVYHLTSSSVLITQYLWQNLKFPILRTTIFTSYPTCFPCKLCHVYHFTFFWDLFIHNAHFFVSYILLLHNYSRISIFGNYCVYYNRSINWIILFSMVSDQLALITFIHLFFLSQPIKSFTLFTISMSHLPRILTLRFMNLGLSFQ